MGPIAMDSLLLDLWAEVLDSLCQRNIVKSLCLVLGRSGMVN